MISIDHVLTSLWDYIPEESDYVYDMTRYGQSILGDRVGENFYTFTGENYDSGTGLVYLRSRYYNVINGRFISRDSYLGNIYEPPNPRSRNQNQNQSPNRSCLPVRVVEENTPRSIMMILNRRKR